MQDGDKIICSWCGRVHTWDWEQDTVCGLDPFTFTSNSLANVTLSLYTCKRCGGTLAIVTDEPSGSTVLTSQE